MSRTVDATGIGFAEAGLSPSQAFFTLLWDQLCDGDAYDAWQLRTMSLSSLLREVVDICILARTFEPLKKALDDVLDEAIGLCQKDPILKEKFQSVVWLLRKLKKEESKDFNQTQLTALHLLDTLRAYPLLVKDEIEVLLSQPEIKNKGRLKFLANALGTELRIRGFSRAYLQEQAGKLATTSFKEVLQDLLNLIESAEKEHTCVFAVKWSDEFKELKLQHGLISSDFPSGNRAEETKFLEEIGEGINVKFIIVRTNAYDVVSAAHQALVAVERLMNLIAFYAPSKQPEVPRKGVLVRSNTESRVVKLDLAHETYIKDSKRLSLKLAEITAAATDQLSAAFQYHALGVQATAPESRLTNFWVALESLLIEQGGSIIERVVRNIAPSVALTYYSRMLRANSVELARYLRSLDRGYSSDAEQLRDLLKIAPKKRNFILPEDLAEVLLDEEKANSLLSLCARDPLLMFRLYQLAGKLRDPAKLLLALEGHRAHVHWQLGRIYRARNALVHRGQMTARPDSLIQHLHTYLVMTLHLLVREMGSGDVLSVAAIFSRRRSLYELYVERIRERKISVRNLIYETGCWQLDGSPPMWRT